MPVNSMNVSVISLSSSKISCSVAPDVRNLSKFPSKNPKRSSQIFLSLSSLLSSLSNLKSPTSESLGLDRPVPTRKIWIPKVDPPDLVTTPFSEFAETPPPPIFAPPIGNSLWFVFPPQSRLFLFFPFLF